MHSREYTIDSTNLNREMRIRRYGNAGLPFIGFPTQCASCTNYEDFGVVRTLEPYIASGEMQLFCIDTVDDESWYCKDGINTWRSARQESYYKFIADEVVRLVMDCCGEKKRPVVLGIDMGATHAAISFFRSPELFCGMIALSGIYDSSYYYHGWMDSTLYDNSIECFLSNMTEDHPWIRKYNNRFMLFCCGRGPWEDECFRSLRNLEKILHKKRINAHVDFWGNDVGHDWVWWRHQLEYFVPMVLKNHSLVTDL